MICKAPSARLRGGEGVAVIGEGRGKGRATAELPGLVNLLATRVRTTRGTVHAPSVPPTCA